MAMNKSTKAIYLKVFSVSFPNVMPQMRGITIEKETSILERDMGPRQSALYPAYIERHMPAP
jgi:hypothetical protein